MSRLQYDYEVPLALCSDIVKNLKSSYQVDVDEKSVFIAELPVSLRHEFSLFMYRNIYKKIDYLKNCQAPFISWICPNLKQVNPIKIELIYIEGDELKDIYFNAHGKSGFILQKFNSVTYITIN